MAQKLQRTGRGGQTHYNIKTNIFSCFPYETIETTWKQIVSPPSYVTHGCHRISFSIFRWSNSKSSVTNKWSKGCPEVLTTKSQILFSELMDGWIDWIPVHFRFEKRNSSRESDETVKEIRIFFSIFISIFHTIWKQPVQYNCTGTECKIYSNCNQWHVTCLKQKMVWNCTWVACSAI